MHPQFGRPTQLGSHAHPCPLLPTEQKKPLKQMASPHAKQEPSSHCTPPRPSSSFGGAPSALVSLGAVALDDGCTVVGAGAEPPQAANMKTGTNGQIFTLLSVDDRAPFVK